MIRIDRSQEPVPAVLHGPQCAGAKERAAAIAYFGSKRKARGKEPQFVVYKHKSVVAALERLFCGKCAYCEARYKSTAPMDVEHYRPKGGYKVKGKLNPGYYWLAAEWSNLLPSCIDCNRERGHPGENGQVTKSGKANYFPIIDEHKRAKRPGHESRESPLLLDPCKDEPAKHLEFMEQGVVRARRGSKRGQTSIDIFGLQRVGLVQDRLELAMRVLATVQNLIDVEADLAVRKNNAHLARVRARLRSELQQAASPKAPFSALAKTLITIKYGTI